VDKLFRGSKVLHICNFAAKLSKLKAEKRGVGQGIGSGSLRVLHRGKPSCYAYVVHVDKWTSINMGMRAHAHARCMPRNLKGGLAAVH
jgi:hypothetical protein